jgi:class 3 adenylate cyclase/predicted ATPase
MFCDLVGSTPLAQRLDPEELREVLRSFQREVAGVISGYRGHVARYMGDGLLVYFGYPQAHEDDPRRAVSAGLGILEAIGRLREKYASDSRVGLAVRIGIHTGLVVLGEMGTGERVEHGDVVGETPNLAARLQGEAEPDSIVISETTFRLVQGFFNCEPLGARNLKGIEGPVALYRVHGLSGVATRLEVAAAKGLTPFVGRAAELELLRSRWDAARNGIPHTVIVNGEAGIGKSRLLRELKQYVREVDHATVELRCAHLYQNTALYPIIDQAERVFQMLPGDSQEQKSEKLMGSLASFGVPMEEAVPHFASLLSLPTPPGFASAQISAERQKKAIFDFSVQMLRTEALRHPVLLIVEDLHWADPTTLDLLGQLIGSLDGMCLFLVMTCRPEFNIPWQPGDKLTVLTLGRLSTEQSRSVIDGAVGGKPLPPDIVDEIQARTEGVPLFVEELTSMVVESGLVEDVGDHYRATGTLAPYAIPESLHDSLMARLDHMPGVKDVAQLAAVLGREFSYDLIQTVSPLTDSQLQEALYQLAEHAIIVPSGSRDNSRYSFKHALIQEAAYQSLLRSTRQAFHRDIVTVLETRFPDMAQSEPELMAHHYTEAGFAERAIGYWQRAAEQAMHRSANIEARSHLLRALALVSQLPDTAQRKKQELTILMALGPVIAALKGITDPEMHETFSRARVLCGQLGEGPELMPVLYGLWLYNEVRAEHAEAMMIARQCLSIAEEHNRPELLGPAHVAMATTYIWQAGFPDGYAHALRGLEYYDPQRDRQSAWVYGLDTRVACLMDLARAGWFLGKADEALEKINESVAQARDIGHAFGIGQALCFTAATHLLRGEGEEALRFGREAIELAENYTLPQWIGAGKIASGWALIDLGDTEEGMAYLQQGVGLWKSIDSLAAMPWFLALLAEGYMKTGQYGPAMDALEEARRLIERTGERFYEAEVHRLRGEVFRLDGQAADAEAAFFQSFDVARSQSALAVQLRAAVGLARIWQQEAPDEAFRLLDSVFARFDEGFGTRDLREAKTLLAELGARVAPRRARRRQRPGPGQA